MDVSISITKVNGRPLGRTTGKHSKGILEHPEKKRILHIIKNLHHVAGSKYRKEDLYKSVLFQTDVF